MDLESTKLFCLSPTGRKWLNKKAEKKRKKRSKREKQDKFKKKLAAKRVYHLLTCEAGLKEIFFFKKKTKKKNKKKKKKKRKKKNLPCSPDNRLSSDCANSSLGTSNKSKFGRMRVCVIGHCDDW
jgi:hypothetical protein